MVRATQVADSYPTGAGDLKLRDEKTLERAEDTLHDWASDLAAHGRDSEAAEALRVSSMLCAFRCGFLEKDKSQ